MATKTRAQMVDWLLEHIGVKAAGVSASAEDGDLAGRIIDSVHDRLDKEGLASYATSAFPEWAQVPFIEVAAAECSTPFQLDPGLMQKLEADRAHGRRELAIQMQGPLHAIPTKARFF